MDSVIEYWFGVVIEFNQLYKQWDNPIPIDHINIIPII